VLADLVASPDRMQGKRRHFDLMVFGGEEPGLLVLVVGPSGAGKDTLMQAFAMHVAGSPGFVFVRRVLTRPEGAGGEDHIAMTDEAFRDAYASGSFCLTWRAHGLAYGVPAEILIDLRAGRTVIVNLSRHMISAAEDLWPRVGVLHVTADDEVRRVRLAARNREAKDDVAARLSRSVEFTTRNAPVVEVMNNTTIETGTALFGLALTELQHRTAHLQGTGLKPS
jgi:phosphonate metabolism protein PhnN/1,5-bisphosphokinase (PRPP-forming)